MNDIRELLQSKFDTIEDLESGVPIPDDLVEDGKTYFGYELQEDYLNSDTDRNYTMQITMIGRIIRKNSSKENTLKIIDNILSDIKDVLKSLNFSYSYKDITDNNIKKILVTASAKYNEINKK